LSPATASATSGRAPGAIARGAGDQYLIRLAGSLARTGRPAYLRFLAEMNNCNVAWSSYGCDGRRRNADHSPARFKQAWKRAYLVMHGGPTAAIDHELHVLGLPALRTTRDRLPQGQVAMMWTPMTGGSPMIAALRPQVYWPGRQWVDWVGTSFYSRFPNFRWLEPFYRTFAQGQHRPFAFGEWAMWGADSAPFAEQLFAWVHSHQRVRMMIYNQRSPTPAVHGRTPPR
jgi:beta-mannanase